MYTFDKIHQTVCIKCMYFIMCKLYLEKVELKKLNTHTHTHWESTDKCDVEISRLTLRS